MALVALYSIFVFIMTIKHYATSQEILELLAKGALLAVALTSPYAGAELIKYFFGKAIDKAWEKYDQARLRQSVKRMINRQILELKNKGGETTVVIAKKGKRLLLRYNFQKMDLVKPEIWDKKWRVVIFDVKEKKRSFRDSLRRKIKSLGLYQLQKSVFVTPYPCENEIAFLREYFNISEGVSCFTALNLEEEDFLKRKFNLS